MENSVDDFHFDIGLFVLNGTLVVMRGTNEGSCGCAESRKMPRFEL
jgi:hypothetical protein